MVGDCMTTVLMKNGQKKNGQKIQVVAPDEHKLVFTDSDTKRAYIEYPNGERRYYNG